MSLESQGEYVAQQRVQMLKKLKSYDDNEIAIQKKPKLVKVGYGDQTFRGSKYRGVSKNKKKWQILLSLSALKQYIGGFLSEEDAAIMYDRKSIATFGLKAKTNFSYSKAQILRILSEEKAIKF